jgi:hypothetical protein
MMIKKNGKKHESTILTLEQNVDKHKKKQTANCTLISRSATCYSTLEKGNPQNKHVQKEKVLC